MSVLKNKTLLYVGGNNSAMTILLNDLTQMGMTVKKNSCTTIDIKEIVNDSVDLLILDHLEHKDACLKFLENLRGQNQNVSTPVFSLVKDSPDEIQESLSRGSADYITAGEGSDSIIRKIEAALNEDSVFSSNPTLDISPIEVNTSLTGIRVFVVEDDPLLQNLLSIRLEKSSFPHEFSSDGKDAIHLMKRFKPDIVILDLMLPGVSGFDVLKEIKGNKDISHIPVIIFSNRDAFQDRAKAKELGAAGFYVKAMTDLSELILTIESLVKKSNNQTA